MGVRSRMKRERRKEEELRKVHVEKIVEVQSDISHGRRFIMGDCDIYLAKEKTSGGFESWHISISCKNRYPSWDEVVRVRYDLMPKNIEMVMFFPSKKENIEIGNNSIHLWQVKFTE